MLNKNSTVAKFPIPGPITLVIALLIVAAPWWVSHSSDGSVQPQNELDVTQIWDLAEIQDPATLDAELVTDPIRKVTLGVPLEVFQIAFNSIDRGNGPIRIHGFVAIPMNHPPGTLPAIVYGHGAGEEGDEGIARQLAAMLKAAAISFSGPGQGLSTGPPSTAGNWLNTIPDIRECWLYQYAYSAMRAVTVLATLPEVDPQRIAMTGISAGGLMTLIANGVDDRLAAAYPIMATGSWRESLQAGSWFDAFPIGEEGLTADSPEVLAFEQNLDPIHYADRQQAPVLLINGAQDEFFPITTTRTTYQALQTSEKRLEVIFDWDHGYYAGSSGALDTYNNTLNAARRIFGNLDAWFDWQVGGGQPLPPTPQVTATQLNDEILFTVAPEDARGARTVRLMYSRDAAWTFDGLAMRRRLDGAYTASLSGNATDLVYFVEVRWPSQVYLTSVPQMPDGFIPRIRPPQ